MRTKAVVLSALIFSVGCIGEVEASVITFTATVTGSGSLGSQAFTDALITITATADTEKVQELDGHFLVAASTYVSVASVGSGNITDNTGMFAAGSSGDLAELAFVVLLEATGDVGSDLLLISNGAFNNYDLQTSLGPISGTPVLNDVKSYRTTAGNFEIDSVSTDVTVAASLTAVPEPSSILMLGIGATIIIMWLRPSLRTSPARTFAA